MAGIKISQLLEVEEVEPGDYLPIARGGLETYKTPATQFVKSGQNVGSGVGQFYSGVSLDEPPSLLFRTLSASGEGLTISNIGNTVVINALGQTPTVTRHTGNGTTRVFVVNGANSRLATNYRVDLDGILQEPDNDYRFLPATNQIEFIKSAPPANSKIVIVTNNLVSSIEAEFRSPVIDNTLQYTIASSDHLKTICMTNTNQNQVLIPVSIVTPGFTVNIVQAGTGATRVVPDAGVFLRARGNQTRILQQYGAATLTYIDATIGWVLYGDLTT